MNGVIKIRAVAVTILRMKAMVRDDDWEREHSSAS